MRDFDHKRGRQLVDCTTEEDTVAEETAGNMPPIYLLRVSDKNLIPRTWHAIYRVPSIPCLLRIFSRVLAAFV